MHYTKVSERDLELVIIVSRGASLSEAAGKYGLTSERVRQIIMRFCRSYLSYARVDGSPERFYPGPDREYQSDYYHEALYSNDPWGDFSTRLHNYPRLVAKGLHYERVDQARPDPGIEGLEELRQYSDWWVEQIEAIRRKRFPAILKKIHQNVATMADDFNQ